MIVHTRIIKKEVYERLSKLRDEMYANLLEKYKKDPEYLQYESKNYNPNGMEYGYCQGCAWAEADRVTLGREIEAARLLGLKHPWLRYEECGCCHNMAISMPRQRPDGDWVITVDIPEPEYDD
jgi:hypothetical protein